jgi:hypothetical protein
LTVTTVPDHIHETMRQAVSGFGGFLRCEACHRVEPLGDIARHLRSGWPKCHDQTMRWWTARQVAAGEHLR